MLDDLRTDDGVELSNTRRPACQQSPGAALPRLADATVQNRPRLNCQTLSGQEHGGAGNRLHTVHQPIADNAESLNC